MIKNKLSFVLGLSIYLLWSLFFTSAQSGILFSAFQENLDLVIPSEKSASFLEVPNNEMGFEYTSAVVNPENEFHALAFALDKEQPLKTSIDLYARVYSGDSWTDFSLIEEDDDGYVDPSLSSYLFSTPVSSAYQYKIVLKTEEPTVSPKINSVSVKAIDARQADQSVNLWDGFIASLNVYSPTDELQIIPRSKWGADESLTVYQDQDLADTDSVNFNSDKNEFEIKYADELIASKIIYKDDDKTYKWPITYPQSVQLIVVHHTASDYTSLDSTEASIKAIYYYHAVSRGWGDIGYNFLIDKDGKIYEGRKNSSSALKNKEPMPVGAHASGFNHGSVGIAMILNAQEHEPSLPALQSLMALSDLILKTYNIDDSTKASMRGISLDRIIGHRDVGRTQCPGDKLYALLPDIKSLVFDNLNNELWGSDTDINININKADYDFEEVTDRSTVTLLPQEAQTLTINLKNIGTKTWDKNTAILLTKDRTDEAKVYFTNNQGVALAMFYMTESQVKPGGTGTFIIKSKSKLADGFLNFQGYLAVNGKKKSPKSIFLPFYIQQIKPNYEIVKTSISNKSLNPGENFNATIILKNTGNITWNADTFSQLKLIDSKFNLGQVISSDPVAPEKSVEIKVKLKAPSDLGDYLENLSFSIGDSNLALVGKAINLQVSVIDKSNPIIMVSRPSKFYFNPEESYRIDMAFKNTSTTDLLTRGNNVFAFKVIKNPIIGIDKVNILKKEIKSGTEFTVTFILKAPKQAGTYSIYLMPTQNGKKLNSQYLSYKFSVKNKQNIDNKEPEIRVALGSLNIDNPAITADKNYTLYLGSQKYKDIPANEIVGLRQENSVVNIVFADQSELSTSDPVKFVPSSDGIVSIANFEHQPEWDSSDSLNDNMYRGILEARIYNNKLILINELPLESYLKGLGEVSNSSAYEKIKAIIVAARTYASYYLFVDKKFPDAPYDLNDDPSVSQKYLGYGFEMRTPNLVKAVDDTKGEMVTYDGFLVKTPYFSSTDGIATKSAEEVWGWTDTPYLVSVPDNLCKEKQFKGHGVGLSGCGAEEAAKLGKTYKEILKYYYTGVEIEKKY